MSTGIAASAIQRVVYGYFVSPPGHPDEGGPVLVSGFVVRHPGGTLLFDTGMSPLDEETREHYHPRMRSPLEALASAGAGPGDIGLIINCHLHMDHAGGNYLFPHVRVLVQEAELEAAGQPDYTFPEYAFEYAGARLAVVNGETDLAPGLRLIPTPGHTPGHQSLLVDTDAGRWLLAGQAANTTWEFSAAALSEWLAASGLDPIGTYPEWMAQLREWGVQRAYFAHDLMVWEREAGDLGQPEPV